MVRTEIRQLGRIGEQSVPVLQGEALTQLPCMSHGKTFHCHAEFHLLHAFTLSEKQIREETRGRNLPVTIPKCVQESGSQ